MQVSFTVGKPGGCDVTPQRPRMRRLAIAHGFACDLIAIKIHWDGNETMRLVRRDVDMNQ
ncbi:hypothetical protein SAMN05428972_3597 [Rhodanobacter sp. OK091]|nr:hypothetical protein SAMN05428972_3597 [Rhodanobacter sp. OK091]